MQNIRRWESTPKVHRTRAKHAVKFFVLARVQSWEMLTVYHIVCRYSYAMLTTETEEFIRTAYRDLPGKKTGCPSASRRLMNAVLEAEAH